MRRTKEESRELLLSAAESVFADRLPDTVGLKDVARAAGVSHALVTHHFGTYDNLVEATLERRFKAMRDQLLPKLMLLVASGASAPALLHTQRRAIALAASDPVTVRLAIWAVLSRRVDGTDFFAGRLQGLKLIADALEPRSTASREDLEFALVASFALTVVWTLGKNAFTGALGRKRSPDMDEAFESRAARMIAGFLDHCG